MKKAMYVIFIKWILAILFLSLLVNKKNPAALLVLALIVFFQGTAARFYDSSQKFAAVISSMTMVALNFICIASFGYAGIVRWWIIAPLLVLTFLINYMGLRIGIATSSDAPRPTATERILMPGLLLIGLFVHIVFPGFVTLHLSLADFVFVALLVAFAILTVRYVKLAYASTQTPAS